MVMNSPSFVICQLFSLHLYKVSKTCFDRNILSLLVITSVKFEYVVTAGATQVNTTSSITCIYIYYMASSASGQDESNPAL